MELYEEIRKDNKILKIFYEEDGESPREWDNLSKLALNHKRYNFSNELNINFDNFGEWDEVENHLKKEFGAVIVKPVYMYEHSGIAISLTPFSCRWDSGQLGFICILKEDIKTEYGKVTKQTLKKAEKVLSGEFETYKNYVEGEVYGFQLFEEVEVKIIKEYKDGKTEKYTQTELKEIDSCWGFFGEEGIKQIKSDCDFN